MTNHTLNVSLSSLEEGTIPSVSPDTLDVSDSDTVTVSVTWPDSPTNDVSGVFTFTNNSQDPFNDVTNGTTSFTGTRPNAQSAATSTLNVMNDATAASDTYDITITINGISYTKDPTILVDDN
ncbi:MAG: hypothetical protein OQJ89_16695 [Kangiellaceae bacterium]|nr:hypothetical protein [Kangiellaceae bacterium]MCW9001007.1 hypothetical protein [Kangiellaceae bacterium]MCW9018614.1 hypothetical protein [Kangiellaceae bacterium]